MLILFASLLAGIVIMQLIAIQEEKSNIKLEAFLIPVRVDESKRKSRNNWLSWKMPPRLVSFLQQELEIPADQIELAERQVSQNPNQLPMVLWQYGLVDLWQLDRIKELVRPFKLSSVFVFLPSSPDLTSEFVQSTFSNKI